MLIFYLCEKESSLGNCQNSSPRFAPHNPVVYPRSRRWSTQFATTFTHITRSRAPPPLRPSPYPAIFPHRAYTPSHPISSHHPSMSPRRTHRQMTITLASLPRNTLKADIRPFFWRFGEVRRISGGLPRRLSVPYRDMPSNPSARAGGRSSCFGNKRSAARRTVIKSLAWIRILPYYCAAGQ